MENQDKVEVLEGKVAKLESENESLHKRLDSLTDEVAKLDEFLVPHGHNRVIPEVIEPQCQSEVPEQSEVAEPQSE